MLQLWYASSALRYALKSELHFRQSQKERGLVVQCLLWPGVSCGLVDSFGSVA